MGMLGCILQAASLQRHQVESDDGRRDSCHVGDALPLGIGDKAAHCVGIVFQGLDGAARGFAVQEKRRKGRVEVCGAGWGRSIRRSTDIAIPSWSQTTMGSGSKARRVLHVVGAGDGTRTHDILLGKQTLYQLSYTRSTCPL